MGTHTLWITGLSGSGKSSVAEALVKARPEFIILSMDEFRKIVTPEPTYSDTEREIVYRSLIYAAKKISELGHNTIIDATGNRKKWREFARQLIPGFTEIYLKCPVDQCVRREGRRSETHGAPRDIYLKGEKGWPVPGVNVPYEEPDAPDLVIESDITSVEGTVQMIEDFLREKFSI